MHPFRFYGARPNHWHDDALIYELCFTDDLDALARQKVAEAWARGTHGSAVGDGRPWLWCGRFALVEVEPRIRSELRPVPVEVADALRSVHAAVPLAQVVFHGATEGADPWTTWSLAQRAPEAGPRWKSWAAPIAFTGPWSVPPEGDAPTPQDADFEAARARAAEDARRADDEARAARAADEGSVELVATHAPLKPVAAPPKEALKLLLANEAVGAGDWWVSLVKTKVRAAHLGEGRRLDDVELPLPARCAAVRDDGLLAVADHTALHLIDLSSGDERSFEAHDLDAIGFAADGRALVLAWSDKQYNTAVLGFVGGEVVELVRLETEIGGYGGSIYEVDGRTYTTGGYELVGLEGALARAADDPRTDFDLTDDWWDA